MHALTQKLESITHDPTEHANLDFSENLLVHTAFVAVPAAASAFLIGFLLGRMTGSYKAYRQLKVQQNLQKRVYVAVVADGHFTPDKVSQAIVRAVADDDVAQGKR